jgi:hypothetical protein
MANALKKKHQPSDTITRVEMRKMMNQVSMKAKENPATLFEQLSGIENRYNTREKQIDEEDLIAVILEKAPKEYVAVLTAEQRRMGDALTMTDLEEAMNQHWRQLYGETASDSRSSDKEIVLAAFNGACFNCGKKGHKSTECRAPPKAGGSGGSSSYQGGGGKQGKFRGACYNCGIQDIDRVTVGKERTTAKNVLLLLNRRTKLEQSRAITEAETTAKGESNSSFVH